MLQVFAPAKINLCLHVTGQRDDGYHLLDTVVGFADVGDSLTLAQGTGVLRVTGPEAAHLQGENIISRSLATFGAQDVDVTLTKNLPIASGIGGGSSDAAAAYRGIIAMHGRGPIAQDSAKLLALGADVPMCAACIPARVQGIGEVITPLPDLAPLFAVLVNPRVHVATSQVFRALPQKQNQGLRDLPDQRHDPAVLLNWLAAHRNDLEAPAKAIAPVIAKVLDALAATGAQLSRMSGSGATCFGIYQSQTAASAAAAHLQLSHPAWWVRACQINGAALVSPRRIDV